MIVVFIDLVGFTALSEAHGDDVASNIIGTFYETVRAEADRHGLSVIKGIGDELLLLGTVADGALQGCMRIMERMGSVPLSLAVRVGLHAGPVIRRDGDVFGRTVNLAARVVDEAGADEIVFTRAVLDELEHELQDVTPMGFRRLRNIPRPVELFRLNVPAHEDHAIDPVCRMRVSTHASEATLDVPSGRLVFCSDACKHAFIERPEAFLINQQRVG